MKLTVEFYKYFDPSVLDGMDYVYAFRTLYMEGSKEHLLEAIRIIDSVTSDRAIVLKGDGDEREKTEPSAREDLLAARRARRAPHLLPEEEVEQRLC